VRPADQGERKIVKIGHISGFHGVNGWVKIHSMTEPREAIFEYQPWLLGKTIESVGINQAVRLNQGKKHGKHLIALFEDLNDRDQAKSLLNLQIAVYRDQFPELPETEYYWDDLIGLTVKLEDGTDLGKIRNLLATGANDVMVVQGERERLIPFVQGPYVKNVDLEQGLVMVDWDPEF
jgi:16S rRNA processing protein RimM